MRRSEYVNDQHVNGFILWIAQRLDIPGAFSHSYYLKKSQMFWSCDSLYSAFNHYTWDFSFYSSVAHGYKTGNTFNDTMSVANMLAHKLKEGLRQGDSSICRDCCLDILKWGGVVRKNDVTISEMGNSLCKYLTSVYKWLRSDRSSDAYYSWKIHINSGFTKIYSLYVEDFIMYDGRVGAALGLLVRMYCEEKNLAYIPESLNFAWGKGKESHYVSSSHNRRNPSSDRFVFPELLYSPQKHLECNIRANWLLKEITLRTKSKFNQLPPLVQATALQAALFMIGYSVNNAQ